MYRKAMAVIVTATLTTVLGAGSALGADRVMRDPRGDAKPAADITRVDFRNGGKRVAATIHFANLKQRGAVNLSIGPAICCGDSTYVVSAAMHDHGFRTRFQLQGIDVDVNVPCEFDAVWNTFRDRVRFSVPQSCVKDMGGAALSLYPQAWAAGSRDYGPSARQLSRG